MRTAQSESKRINKEIEAKMGGAPPEVVPPVEVTPPPTPPATPPPAEPPKKVEAQDTPPAAPPAPPTPPTPPPVAAEPTAPPPVPPPPATPPPAPPAAATPAAATPAAATPAPEPEKDYKLLYEQTQAKQPKQAQAYKTMQGLWQQTGNRVLELEAENAALRAQPPQPDPVDPPPTPVPAAPPEKNEAIEKYLAQQREDYGAEYVAAHENFIREVAAEAVKAAVTDVQTGYENIRGRLDETQRQQVLNNNGVFESEVTAQHPDWEQVLEDEAFKTWLLEHSHGELFWPLVYPQQGQLSMTSGETAALLTEYKEASPAFQDQAARDEETRRRQAAAAASDQGDIHTVQPELQVEGEYILLSDIPKMQRQLGNNPKALMEFNAKVEAAQAAGMIVNDNMNSPFQGGVTP